MLKDQDLISEVPREDRQELKDVLKLCEQLGYKVAFHKDDADGIISGAMARVLLTKYDPLIPVPLSYNILRSEKILRYLGQLDWIAITH